MKIVVIGGTGLIGSKLVEKLRRDSHDVVATSPDSGVSTVTGEGLAEALRSASVVVDLSSTLLFEDAQALKFFETFRTRKLLVAEAAAGVRHHVALSLVGTERLSESGYFRAKIAQEKLIKESSIPRSSMQRSSSSASRASPMPPPTATPCAWHPCSSSPWRPTMSPVQSVGPRWARP